MKEPRIENKWQQQTKGNLKKWQIPLACWLFLSSQHSFCMFLSSLLQRPFFLGKAPLPYLLQWANALLSSHREQKNADWIWTNCNIYSKKVFNERWHILFFLFFFFLFFFFAQTLNNIGWLYNMIKRQLNCRDKKATPKAKMPILQKKRRAIQLSRKQTYLCDVK